MKIPFLILCALVSLSVKSQEYVPLLNEDHTWKQLVYGWTTYGQEIKIEGDTSIGEFTYKKIYAATEPFWDLWYLQGAFREDIAEQTIYRWNGTFDDVVYKFNVEEGESFSISPMGYPITMMVSSTGTTTVNNVLRKTITFDNDWYTETWIVGVGSSLGVLNPASNFPDFSPSLTCFYIGNDLAYDNPNEDNECGLFLGVENESEFELSLYPNPCQNRFRMDLPQGQFFDKLEIIDTKGSCVKFINSITSNNEIDINELSDGMYYVKLIMDQKTVKVIPLIKQTDFGEK
jgi:hypothetical protein